ncbi:MAG: glucans biosynthesis glucosyltransferase MdoH [Steroidobacterales bacterium]
MDPVASSAKPPSVPAYHSLWRRLIFFGLTALTALTGGFLMLDILKANGLSQLELAGLLLFICLFTWIGGAFWTAVAGFTIRLFDRSPALLDAGQLSWRPLYGRVAIVMPVHNEDTQRVAAGVNAIWSSLTAEAQASAFDFFILSDSRLPDIVAVERRAWRALVEHHDAYGRIFYRHRSDNVGRKAGNIADFVRNWGGSYEYMVVLDADSIMSGQALVQLAQLMEAHAEIGILQALPLLAGRDTLFARMIQFAVRLNGPMFATGLAFWQLGDSNYWGHNAIVRVRAFAEHCALPRLPGSPPFGGEIMSHDFVEAAFIRRAGYQIWLLPDIKGSWEEVPSNILDFAQRDRRWAQGNLQHVGVLPIRGLHWMSRLHMLTGILSYATSPMWFIVLVLSSIITCIETVFGHQYFPPGLYSLFPAWPEYRDAEIAALLSITIIVLILPKLLGAILALKDRALRHTFGGAPKLLLSLVLEQLLSMLLAPTMMLFHSTFVLRTLIGHPVSWDAQQRGDRGVNYREAFARHKWHVLLGLVWGSTILLFAPKFIWWMLPVITGMLLSMPLTVLTSRTSLGRRARAFHLLMTPEETAPPPELAALSRGLKIEDLSPVDESAIMMPALAPLPMVAAPPSYVQLRHPPAPRDRITNNS